MQKKARTARKEKIARMKAKRTSLRTKMERTEKTSLPKNPRNRVNFR